MHGFIDRIENGILVGWAWNASNGERVTVDVMLNGRKVATLTPKLFRKDLAEKDIGDGCYGFRVDLKPSLLTSPSGPLSLRLYVHGIDDFLEGNVDSIFNSFSLSELSDIDKHKDNVTNLRASHFDFRNVSRAVFEENISKAAREGKTTFVFPPLINWDISLFQRPQQLALALGDVGCQVIYVTPNFGAIEFEGFGHIRENLLITSDWDYVKENVIGSFLVSSTSGITLSEMELIRRRGGDVIYDYIDHITDEISGEGARWMMQRHENLVLGRTVTAVTGSSKILHQELLNRFPSEAVGMVQNGVDVAHYDNSEVSEVMARIKGSGRPIAGYFGAIAPWLDYETINYAFDNAKFDFVIIGPDYDGRSLRRLNQRSNVHILGAVPYWDLPTYANAFDVALIPFLPGDIAQTTSPLKLFEYFAAGLPTIVEADMIECRDYFGVETYRGGEQFVAALNNSLAKYSDQRSRKKIRENAHANSWLVRAKALVELVERSRAVGTLMRNHTSLSPNKVHSIARSLLRSERTLRSVSEWGRTSFKSWISTDPLVRGDTLRTVIDLSEVGQPCVLGIDLEVNGSAVLDGRFVFQVKLGGNPVGFFVSPSDTFRTELMVPVTKGVLPLEIVFTSPVDCEPWEYGQCAPVDIKEIKIYPADLVRSVVDSSGRLRRPELL